MKKNKRRSGQPPPPKAAAHTGRSAVAGTDGSIPGESERLSPGSREEPREPGTGRGGRWSKIVRNGDWPYLLGLAAVLVLIVVIRSRFLEIPFERDEGAYAYGGRLILDGAVPFKDLGSQRLPGVFYLYGAIIAVFGYTLTALHVAFTVVNLLSAILIFIVARRLLSNLAALAAALFWALLSMHKVFFGFTIQSEHLVVLFALGGMACLLQSFERAPYRWAALSGLCFAFAFETKQTSFFLGLFAGALLVGRHLLGQPRNVRRGLVSGLVFSAAVLAPLALDLAIVWLRGGWEDFHYWFFDIRREYASFVSLKDGQARLKAKLLHMYTDYKFIWLASLGGATAIWATKTTWWTKITVAGLYVFGFFTVMPGRNYFGHYFLQWVPAVCLSAAAFVYAAEEFVVARLPRRAFVRPVILSVVLLFCVAHLAALRTYYFNPDYTQVLREAYGRNPFPESKVIADKLNALLKPEDTLAVLGTEIQMYFYTNRTAPSRFAGSGALLEFPGRKSEEWQREFISDVERAEPDFLVYFQHPLSWLVNSRVKNLIIPWLTRFLVEKYHLVGYADMIPPPTRYGWAPNLDVNAGSYRSEMKIFVFEKNR